MLVRRGKLTQEEAAAMLQQDFENFREVPQETKDRFYQRISI